MTYLMKKLLLSIIVLVEHKKCFMAVKLELFKTRRVLLLLSGSHSCIECDFYRLMCFILSRDNTYRKQGTKLRRLMTFAWPCLIQKNCVDPTTKYHGHLLLAHNIAKFAIHKRIVLQVMSLGQY